MLKIPPQDAFSSLDELGVAIRNSNIAGMLHLGVLYQGETEARILHLTTDNARDDPPSEEYCWVQCGLGEVNCAVVAALCVDVSAKLVKGMYVPYGFTYNGEYFEPTGNYIGNYGLGLTCSTFIMALFRTFGIELVKVDEWPAASAEDQFLQISITAGLAAKRPDVENTLKDQWGSPRFRPEQVAASSTKTVVPIGVVEANRLGKRILRDFEKAKRS